MARMLLAVTVVAVTLVRFLTGTLRKDLITPILSAVLLASLAGVGHSQIEDGWAGVIHEASDVAHLLAAGAWLGGLVPLDHVFGEQLLGLLVLLIVSVLGTIHPAIGQQ